MSKLEEQTPTGPNCPVCTQPMDTGGDGTLFCNNDYCAIFSLYPRERDAIIRGMKHERAQGFEAAREMAYETIVSHYGDRDLAYVAEKVRVIQEGEQ